jgi:diguanylate cyclase (GGDEF)-like protein/PAS domain S-box-containing protein
VELVAAESEPEGVVTPAAPVTRSALDVLRAPVNLVAIPALAVLVLARHFGWIANEPLWMIVGALCLALFAPMSLELVLPAERDETNARIHLGLQIALVGVVIYVTGWGSLLAIGFVFSAAGLMGEHGSRLGRYAMVFSVLTIAAGEVAVGLGLKTMIPEPAGHGLAMLECAGLCAVIWILMYTQQERERSEERFRALVQHASDGIVVVDETGATTYASPAIERLLGVEAGQLVRFDADWLHPEDVDELSSTIEGLLEHPDASVDMELRVRHGADGYRWIHLSVANLLHEPAVKGLVCNLHDIEDRRNTQQLLEFQAQRDALTHLPNRWYFVDQLEHAQRLLGSERHIAVLFVDLDDFKLVNDSLGHEFGDRLLVAVTDRLAQVIRSQDVIGRLGGDEFAVLLRNIATVAEALGVAERITTSLAEPFWLGGHEVFASASIGVAISDGATERGSDLLKQADQAMYVAKERGRTRWELFEPAFATRATDRLELERDLRRALERRELEVHFQPELSLGNGAVLGAEALLRWTHPRKGPLEPSFFVALAEESALIVDVDRFVLREACGWAHAWSTRDFADPMTVSVNLSPRFLRQPNAVAEITQILNEAEVDPRCVQLEITERSALTDLAMASSQLHELRGLGVRVAIDDFGTGYSALSCLKDLPIDVLKLDKSFVQSIDSSPANVAIVEAIIAMAHALDVSVTAEGVERSGQAELLRTLGCDTATGWIWAPAMAPGEFESYVPKRCAPAEAI